MSYNYVPSKSYRKVLKRGMSGTDVAALQLNLHNVTVDGVFGKKTHASVIDYQKANPRLVVDGKAGLFTQGEIIKTWSREAEVYYDMPENLLMSISFKETSFAIAAVSQHPSDDGFDLGAYQDSITPGEIGSQEAYEAAYDVKGSAFRFGQRLDQMQSLFVRSAFVTRPSTYSNLLNPGLTHAPETYAWQLAVLDHNWPYAAENIATIGRPFKEIGLDKKTAEWVQKASGGRLATPMQWIMDYIDTATVYTDLGDSEIW